MSIHLNDSSLLTFWLTAVQTLSAINAAPFASSYAIDMDKKNTSHRWGLPLRNKYEHSLALFIGVFKDISRGI